MQIMEIEGYTRKMTPPPGVSDEDCGTLAIRDIPDPVFGNFMWSKWQPSLEEITALMAGAPIYLLIGGTVHPVVSLAVGEAVNDHGES